jgi:hypothetical protein
MLDHWSDPDLGGGREGRGCWILTNFKISVNCITENFAFSRQNFATSGDNDRETLLIS